MNSDKQSRSGVRGNALIYVLIALALLGALTMLLSKQGTESDDTSYEKTELQVAKLTAFAASAKDVVDKMMMSGTTIGNLNYVMPGAAGYDTAPHYNKVFHPDGGGLNYPTIDSNIFDTSLAAPGAGWFIGRFNNVEWTPTTAQDILLVARGVSQSACANIDKKITGSSTIPTMVVAGSPLAYLISASLTGTPNLDFTKTVCPACDGYPALCISDGANYNYYVLISGQ